MKDYERRCYKAWASEERGRRERGELRSHPENYIREKVREPVGCGPAPYPMLVPQMIMDGSEFQRPLWPWDG